MKKILLLFITFFSLSVSAQIYTINPQLKLNTVTEGTANDSVLVRAADGLVKHVPQSSIQGTLPTGLEAIDEGNGIGYRLSTVDSADYGNIGRASIDLNLIDPYGSSPANIGVAAEASFSAGIGNIITGGGYSAAIGSGNEITSSSYSNSAIGNQNKILSGYGNTAIGIYNEINSSSNGFATLAGMNNRASNTNPAGAIGTALDVRSRNHFAVGAANTIWAGTNSAVDRPIFTVGNGTYTTPSGPWEAAVRSDAFNVRYDGVVEAPSLSITEINSGHPYILTTKEWVNSVIPTATPTLNEVTLAGGISEQDIALYGALLNYDDEIALEWDSNGRVFKIKDLYGPTSYLDIDVGNNVTILKQVTTRLEGELDLNGNRIITNEPNGNITLQPNGVGLVEIASDINITNSLDNASIKGNGTTFIDYNDAKGDIRLGTALDVYVRSNGRLDAPQFKLNALNTAPVSATDTGLVGEIRITADYIYVCVAANTWKRTALSAW